MLNHHPLWIVPGLLTKIPSTRICASFMLDPLSDSSRTERAIVRITWDILLPDYDSLFYKGLMPSNMMPRFLIVCSDEHLGLFYKQIWDILSLRRAFPFNVFTYLSRPAVVSGALPMVEKSCIVRWIRAHDSRVVYCFLMNFSSVAVRPCTHISSFYCYRRRIQGWLCCLRTISVALWVCDHNI